MELIECPSCNGRGKGPESEVCYICEGTGKILGSKTEGKKNGRKSKR